MKNARFWTGLVFCTGLPLSLVMGTVGRDSMKSSSVYGKVSYNGRPLSSGLVLFESLDRVRSPDIVALIDHEGRFNGRAEWQLNPPGRTQFRIHVYPDPRENQDSPILAPAGNSGNPAEERMREILSHRVSMGNGMAVVEEGPASIDVETPGPNDESRMEDGGLPTRNRPMRRPEIWLGPEPTHIDIDLKD